MEVVRKMPARKIEGSGLLRHLHEARGQLVYMIEPHLGKSVLETKRADFPDQSQTSGVEDELTKDVARPKKQRRFGAPGKDTRGNTRFRVEN